MRKIELKVGLKIVWLDKKHKETNKKQKKGGVFAKISFLCFHINRRHFVNLKSFYNFLMHVIRGHYTTLETIKI